MEPLHGVCTIALTPFTENGDVDEEGIASLSSLYLDAGVHGVTVLGIMGEAHIFRTKTSSFSTHSSGERRSPLFTMLLTLRTRVKPAQLQPTRARKGTMPLGGFWRFGAEEDGVAELEYGVENGVGTILLNRPERKNAFTVEMVDRWAEVLREVRRDDAVGVVVVTGTGDAFCSGGELSGLAPGEEGGPTTYERKSFLTEHVHQVALALEDLDKPVVAAVNGVAVGAGMDMALMCDMRFMARSARMSQGYIKVGLVPGDGGCYWLPRLCGTAKALELILTGDPVDAEEALRIGVVNRVYDDEALMEETRAFAERLAAGPPTITRMVKRAVYQSARSDLRTSLDLISSHMAVVQSMEEHAEAFNAFREKRPPNFEGR